MTTMAAMQREMDPYATFRGLSPQFLEGYFTWHSSGQYEGVKEFRDLRQVYDHPPPRERDDWYSEELRVVDQCYRSLAESRVLEIGCGDGNLTWKLAQRCRSLKAVDMDPRAVGLTRHRLSDLGMTRVELECRAGDDVSAAELGGYDVVFFVQVLEHVPGWQQGKLFDKVFSLVAPGGCLFISTPNRWSIRDSHDTDRLFIHWWPRWIRIPVARAFDWGLKGHDPAWPYPPVLHDYVSFRWMLRRARRAWPPVKATSMSFYPTVNDWFSSRVGRSDGTLRQISRRLLKQVGGVLPLNYYFGEKVIFLKA